MEDIKFTTKQIEILRTIKEGNSDSTLCSVYDIMEKVSYTVKRDAMLHSIKILVDNGYIDRSARELREGKSVRVYRVTTKAAEII